MGMSKVKVAIATKGPAGLWDEVSEFFAKTKTFTLATVKDNKVHIEVLQNPGAALLCGRGRTTVQTLRDRGVNVVVTSELGLGASALLEQGKIDRVIVRAGTRVSDVIRDKLYKKHKRLLG